MSDPNYARYGPKPKCKAVTIGLQTFQLVNWFDYRGWEVREFSEHMDFQEAPVTLGWVSQCERADGANVWEARRPGDVTKVAYPTRVRAILSISNNLLDSDDEDALSPVTSLGGLPLD